MFCLNCFLEAVETVLTLKIINVYYNYTCNYIYIKTIKIDKKDIGEFKNDIQIFK